MMNAAETRIKEVDRALARLHSDQSIPLGVMLDCLKGILEEVNLLIFAVRQDIKNKR